MSGYKVAEPNEIAVGDRKLCEADGRRFVLIHLEGAGLLAFDNHCPHRGGPIGAGSLQDGRITCPWHGLSFDLPSGEGCGHQASLSPLRIECRDDGVFVLLGEQSASPAEELVCYLVRYSAAAHVGKFACSEPRYERGDRVLLQTQRGRELGEVLAQQSEAANRATMMGELLRTVTEEEWLAHERLQSELEPLVEVSRGILNQRGTPIQLLDAEFLFDGDTVILYHLGPSTELLGRLAAELVDQHGYRFQFESLDADQSSSPATSAKGADEVKGPYERLKHDLRRVWECPVCGRHERWSGNITTVLCPCQKKEPPLKQQWMKMIGEGAKP